MVRKGKTLGSAWNFSCKVKLTSRSLTAALPKRQVAKSAQIMKSVVSIRPGITPARKSRPMDVSVAMP